MVPVELFNPVINQQNLAFHCCDKHYIVSVLFFTGMALHQLICFLYSGKRLMDPEFCPLPISRLIKHCFQQNPGQRPDFADIKKDLTCIYETILEHANPTNYDSSNDSNPGYSMMFTKSKPSTMETQYATVLKENQTTNATDDTLKTNKQEYHVVENQLTKYASFERKPMTIID